MVLNFTKPTFGYIFFGAFRQILAEVHWYEAIGIGRKELKIKRLLDPPE